MNDNLTFQQELELATIADQERKALEAQIAAQKAEEEQARIAAMQAQAAADELQQREDDTWYAAHYEVRELEPQYLQARQELQQAQAIVKGAYSNIQNATIQARANELNSVYNRIFQLNNQVQGYVQNAGFKYNDFQSAKNRVSQTLSDIEAGILQTWNLTSAEQLVSNLTRQMDEILAIYPFMSAMTSVDEARTTAQAQLDAGVLPFQLELNEAQRQVAFIQGLSAEQQAQRYNRPDLQDAIPVALANLELAQANFDNLEASYNLAIERQAGPLRAASMAQREAIEAAQAAERAQLAYEREQIESTELGQRLLAAQQAAADARLRAQEAEQAQQAALAIQAEQQRAAEAAAYLAAQEAAAAAKAAAEAERARIIAEQARAEEARIAEMARQQAAAEAQAAYEQAQMAQAAQQAAADQQAAAALAARAYERTKEAAMQAQSVTPISVKVDTAGEIDYNKIAEQPGLFVPTIPGAPPASDYWEDRQITVDSPDGDISVLLPPAGTGDVNMPSFNLFPNDELAIMSVADKVNVYLELKAQGVSDQEIIEAYQIPAADWNELMKAVAQAEPGPEIGRPLPETQYGVLVQPAPNAGLLIAAGLAALTLLG